MSEEGPKGEDFQRISRTFDIIKHLIASKHPRADQPLTDFFKRFVAQVITDWTTILGKDMNSQLLRLEGIKAKFKLWQMCAEKGITYLKSVDQTLSEVFAEIFTQQALCLVASFELVKHAVGKSEEVSHQNKERDEELMRQRKEVEQVLAVAEELEASVAGIKQERDRYKAELDGIRSEVEGQILSLQTENERYFKQIVKLSKERAEASLNTPSSQIATPKYMNTSLNITQLFQGSACKEFTLRQLKVLIEDVYESKARSDEQNRELKQPLETLEQHLQSYLGQKYGLKVRNI
jgi:hypothetical protein